MLFFSFLVLTLFSHSTAHIGFRIPKSQCSIYSDIALISYNCLHPGFPPPYSHNLYSLALFQLINLFVSFYRFASTLFIEMNAWSSVHPVSYIFHVLLFHSISLPSIPSFHWLSHSPVPIVRSFIFSVVGISLLTSQLTCLSSPLSCMFGYHFLYSVSFSLAPHFITFLSSLISIKFSPAHSHRCLVSRIYRYGGCGPFGLLVWDLR